jgi:hypothetical protein
VPRSIFIVPLGLAAAFAAYLGLARRPVMTWGASDAEASAVLPGDDLLDHADGASTRAVTIAAPRSAVWPWLAQMGPRPRGGVYSYDWIENLLGLDIHSVDYVMPEFQHPETGDEIALGSNVMRIELVEPERTLAFRSADGAWLWSFNLQDGPEAGTTRLISRNRFRLQGLASRIGMLALEPGSLIMERKMLHGIKSRAERLSAS